LDKIVDSFRFVDPLTQKVIKNWIKIETTRPIPWTPLIKPLSECIVALLSTGGIALKTDQPFSQEGERQNPWWGDPSYRIIPRSTTSSEIKSYHLHINTALVQSDLNCLLPIDRLVEMEKNGEIGQAALSHYSTMGYILNPQELLEKTVPKIVQHLKDERVDILVLVPA